MELKDIKELLLATADQVIETMNASAKDRVTVFTRISFLDDDLNETDEPTEKTNSIALSVTVYPNADAECRCEYAAVAELAGTHVRSDDAANLSVMELGERIDELAALLKDTDEDGAVLVLRTERERIEREAEEDAKKLSDYASGYSRLGILGILGVSAILVLLIILASFLK